MLAKKSWFKRMRLKEISRAFRPVGLSIDLGTANTLIYIPEHGIVLNEPSVVAIKKNASSKPDVCAVGLQAKKMEGRTPGHIQAIRPLKDGVIADFYVTERMLNYCINQLKKMNYFYFSPRVVVCAIWCHSSRKAGD